MKEQSNHNVAMTRIAKVGVSVIFAAFAVLPAQNMPEGHAVAAAVPSSASKRKAG